MSRWHSYSNSINGDQTTGLLKICYLSPIVCYTNRQVKIYFLKLDYKYACMSTDSQNTNN